MSLGLQRNSCLVKNGSGGHPKLQDGESAAFCIGEGDKDQRLTDFVIRSQRFASVVVLRVLHMLAMTAVHILVRARYVDSVVQVRLRHVQPVPSGAVGLGQRQGKQGVRLWAGETGLGKQAG